MQIPQDPYLYFGNLGTHERQYCTPNYVGLALYPKHDREIKHDATDPLPFPDNSIKKIQSQDVFEHIPREKIPFIFNEIFRVLLSKGVFRLSLPDYRAPLLRRRSIFDHHGNVIGDTMMGAQAFYNSAAGNASTKFTNDGNSHVWFPKYEDVLELIIKSNLRHCASIQFHEYFSSNETYFTKEFPDLEMNVMRSSKSDPRSEGKPISIIVDFIK